MSSYKLIYFNARGRAELSRLVFAAAGQKYEDFRVERENWPALKEKMPFHQVPVLEVTEADGTTTTLAQSHTIARFLARRFGLAGSSDIEAALVDMYVDQVADVATEAIKIHFEQDAEKKQALKEKFEKEVLPKNFGFFEARLKANGSNGHLVGNKCSLADLALFNLLDYCKARCEKCLDCPNCIELKKLYEKVSSCDKIKSWLESRPKTEL